MSLQHYTAPKNARMVSAFGDTGLVSLIGGGWCPGDRSRHAYSWQEQWQRLPLLRPITLDLLTDERMPPSPSFSNSLLYRLDRLLLLFLQLPSPGDWSTCSPDWLSKFWYHPRCSPPLCSVKLLQHSVDMCQLHQPKPGVSSGSVAHLILIKSLSSCRAHRIR